MTIEEEPDLGLAGPRDPAVHYALTGGEMGRLSSWSHAEALIATLPTELALLSAADHPPLRRAAVIRRRSTEFAVELGIVRGTVYSVTIRDRSHTSARDVVAVLELYFMEVDSDHIAGRSSGRIIVHTLSGTRYEINLDLMLLRRLRNTTHPNLAEVPVSLPLRGDGNRLKILRIVDLSVGRPAVLDLEPLGRGPFTRRTTTKVLLIERIS